MSLLILLIFKHTAEMIFVLFLASALAIFRFVSKMFKKFAHYDVY